MTCQRKRNIDASRETIRLSSPNETVSAPLGKTQRAQGSFEECTIGEEPSVIRTAALSGGADAAFKVVNIKWVWGPSASAQSLGQKGLIHEALSTMRRGL